MSQAERAEEIEPEIVDVQGLPLRLRREFTYTSPPAHETRRTITGRFRVDDAGTVRLTGVDIEPYGLDVDEMEGVSWAGVFQLAIMRESWNQIEAETDVPSLGELMDDELLGQNPQIRALTRSNFAAEAVTTKRRNFSRRKPADMQRAADLYRDGFVKHRTRYEGVDALEHGMPMSRASAYRWRKWIIEAGLIEGETV